MDQKVIFEIQSRLSELKVRARKVGFVDILPTIPVFKKEHPYAHASQLRGFNGRLNNWENNLKKMEFVNAKPVKEVKEDSLQLPEGVKLIG